MSVSRSCAMRDEIRAISLACSSSLRGPVGHVGTEALGPCVRRDVRRRATCGPRAGVGVGELHLPEPEALHLAAGEHDAGFEHVEDRVVVPGAPVAGDDDGRTRSIRCHRSTGVMRAPGSWEHRGYR